MASIILFLLSNHFKGLPKSLNQISPRLKDSPIQTPIKSEKFEVYFKNKNYSIVPIYEYEISGLVVSRNNTTGFGDIYHDENSFDTIDVCIIWGSNIQNTAFTIMEFWNVSWTCNWRYPRKIQFNHSEISNNHLVTDSNIIRKNINNIKVGDQIRIKGKLVNYQQSDSNFIRKSSTTRTDTGNGACEVIFVEDFETIKPGTPVWYFINKYSLYALIFLSIIFIYRYFTKGFN